MLIHREKTLYFNLGSGFLESNINPIPNKMIMEQSLQRTIQWSTHLMGETDKPRPEHSNLIRVFLNWMKSVGLHFPWLLPIIW